MARMFFKPKYLEFILSGKKLLEGRVGYENISRLKEGDTIYLNGKYKAKITEIEKHPSFDKAVTEENYKLLIPDAKSVNEAIEVYNKLFPKDKQEKLGVFIFRLKYPA